MESFDKIIVNDIQCERAENEIKICKVGRRKADMPWDENTSNSLVLPDALKRSLVHDDIHRNDTTIFSLLHTLPLSLRKNYLFEQQTFLIKYSFRQWRKVFIFHSVDGSSNALKSVNVILDE